MVKIFFWFSMVISSTFSLAVKEPMDKMETENNLVAITIPEKDLKLFRKIYRDLDTFLERNLKGGFEKLKKVFSEADIDMAEVSTAADLEAPLETFLLRHQMALHRDLKGMLSDLKDSLTRLTRSVELSQNKSLSTNGKRSNMLDIPDKSTYTPTDYTVRPSDCSEILVSGHKKSGVYQIYPFRCKCTQPLEVFCDMETDGGGWTVFLNRQNYSKQINFTRKWEGYKTGFGSAKEEYWLGNDILHTLTSSRNYAIRLDARDINGRKVWGKWNVFKVEHESLKYKVTIKGYDPQSTALDTALSFNDGGTFTTIDRDHDTWDDSNCAEKWKGGWWYTGCSKIKATGIYNLKKNIGVRVNDWSVYDNTTCYATFLQLKIRPTICDEHMSFVEANFHNCNFS